MKIKTWRNYDYNTDSLKFATTDDTMTEPGQDLTPKQMVQRFSNGRPINAKPGFYEFGSEAETNVISPMRDLQWLDKLERAHYLRAIKKEIETLKKSIDPDSSKSIENTIEDTATKLETEHNNPETEIPA